PLPMVPWSETKYAPLPAAERHKVRFHSPVSLTGPVTGPNRRALPLPLPDAPSPLLPWARLQPAAGPLCPADHRGTLSVHRADIPIILPTLSRRVNRDFAGRGGTPCPFPRRAL